MEKTKLLINTVLVPAEAEKIEPEGVCIVIDVLRASSTIVTLMSMGCQKLYTVETIEEAISLAQTKDLMLLGERDGIPLKGVDYGNSPVAQTKDLMLLGERDGIPLKGVDYGNSPAEISKAQLAKKEAVLTTTNGTKAIARAAQKAAAVLVGCFLNASACCQKASELAKDYEAEINIICAGEKGKFALDDAFCAGYLIQNLLSLNSANETELSDAALACHKLYASYSDILTAFSDSSSGKRLIQLDFIEDLSFCSRIDTTSAVPTLQQKSPCLFGNETKKGAEESG